MHLFLAAQAFSLVALVSSAPLPANIVGDPFNPQDKFDNPQEHSHENIVTSVRASLQKNNPLKLGDPVVALLGDVNAKPGLDGSAISDVECFQAAIADTAFTNAKKAGDLQGQVDALIYRALQRNKGTEGISGTCTSFKPTNPEVAALSQHQNPNAANAQATNKQSALDLAKQIHSIGGNPQDAIKSGTFAPGSQTCDGVGAVGQNGLQSFDAGGCIFTLNLLNPDVTADEINSFIGTSSSGASAASPAASPATPADDPASPAANPAAPAAKSGDGKAGGKKGGKKSGKMGGKNGNKEGNNEEGESCAKD